MAYDEELADRMRELLGAEPNLTEKKMFGGLAFLIGGNMAIAASGQGGALVRVDPEQSDRLVETTAVELMVMRGRPMEGWLRVGPDGLRTRQQLTKWVRLGAGYARALPPKAPKTAKPRKSPTPRTAPKTAKRNATTKSRRAR
jgi:hypothetical protein